MDFDVVVVGAGPGGCVAARDFARAGLAVGLFDMGAREKAAKPITIEAEKSIFAKVDVSPPTEDEVPYHFKGLRVFSRRGREAFSLGDLGTSVAIYLDKFVARLLRDAESAGVKIFEKHKATAPIMREGKVCGAIFDNNGNEQIVKARLVIDATGFNAALVRKLDPEMGIEYAARKSDEIIAENYQFDIKVPEAERAVKTRLQMDEEVWIRLGFAGCSSVEFSHLSMTNRRAYVLMAIKAGYEGPPIGKFTDDFTERMGYFGDRIHGGVGMIRMAHSLDKLVADGFMAIGEAACQVIPANGSGVSSALYAGHLAAKVGAPVLKNGDPTTGSLWPYAWMYQKKRGAELAALDVSRLIIDSLTENDLEAMLESGIVAGEDIVNASIPRAISMSSGSLPSRIAGLAKNPKYILPIAKMGITTLTVLKHYQKYPKQYNRLDFEKWKTRNNAKFAPLMKK